MKVENRRQVAAPAYPSRRQFVECRLLVGVAAIGLGAAVGRAKRGVLMVRSGPPARSATRRDAQNLYANTAPNAPLRYPRSRIPGAACRSRHADSSAAQAAERRHAGGRYPR